MSEPEPQANAPTADLAALARGGRINFMGFVLRLAARLPFLFIAGRMYGAAALGRFAYAILIVEFAAQLATLGLKRGLAQQLAHTDKPHPCVAWDALVVALLGSLLMIGILVVFPEAMYPNSPIAGLDRLLPITIIALAWSDIMLAALAYRHDVGATVRARAIVEPWTISIAALVLAFLDKRDGLIIAYVMSMIGALLASAVPFLKSYGLPHDWRPEPGTLWRMARKNIPVAAADAVEWGSRRVDIAVLGLFFSPAIVGVYYVAQQVASLPSKLKTSFDPILGPVIAQNLQAGNKQAVARQVRQVGFWVIAAQTGVALALGIPGEGVMGLVGPNFVSGTAALGFLLTAEVVAAMAAVSEAALIYIASHRNMWISLSMIVLEAALAVALILIMRKLEFAVMWQATGPAIALLLSLAYAAIAKSRLLCRLLDAPVSGWRWPLVWAAGAAVVVGQVAILMPEWAELVFGIPVILVAFGAVLWTKGFGPEDRELFRMSKRDIAELSLPDPSTGGDVPR
ncbi:oligosaccharide flippase family protein [Sphingomonas sp. RG327]|uniref:Oligosaccharide flippase family protein n=1 Tax=Sphingomonas anseongensis TaxID=2908207 RepID=A0ABT0RHN4_9SPHN|nr:oligosaccharide flippase family protein [Sphingomonas anseongensis]MCL6679445.1 oligosaccharide flippase family protein [Sphingomonas anseongensis]